MQRRQLVLLQLRLLLVVLVLVIGMAKRIIAALMRNMCASRGYFQSLTPPTPSLSLLTFFSGVHTLAHMYSGQAIFMLHPGCHCLTKNLVKHHRRRRCRCRCARPASLCASTLILHVKRLSLSPTPPPKAGSDTFLPPPASPPPSSCADQHAKCVTGVASPFPIPH